jgi:hypothetical protein
MIWHKTDGDLETAITKLNEIETDLRQKLRTVRKYQGYVYGLRKVGTNETSDDGTSNLIYSNPNDLAGNVLEDNYRETQKAKLIANVNGYLDANHNKTTSPPADNQTKPKR